MRRNPSAGGRHHRLAVVPAVDRPRGRGPARRLGPLAVGALVMLVATTVATAVSPSEDTATAGPDLKQALKLSGATTGRPSATPTSSPSPAASLSPAVVPGATTGATRGIPTAASRSAAAATTGPTAAPRSATPTPAPVARAAPAPRNGDGVQAAASRGWTLATADEFDGGMSGNWGVYDGAGHAGNGRRTADAASVENGALVIRGDSNGNTGGMAWGRDQRFGKWEMRARFPAGDEQYHPVLLLWPNGSWPAGGEVDFAETTSASSDVSFFLHYSSSNQQKDASRAVDLTQWHNYAVEWVDGRITGFIDGEKWFESTDGATLPPDKMHAAIQLDYFPEGGNPRPSEMHVDYMRIYE